MGQGIMYQCLPSEDCDRIMKTLQNICNMINSDIHYDLSQYDERKSKHKALAKNLLLYLDHLQYANKLRFDSNLHGSSTRSINTLSLLMSGYFVSLWIFSVTLLNVNEKDYLKGS